jgi:hypothetical protein
MAQLLNWRNKVGGMNYVTTRDEKHKHTNTTLGHGNCSSLNSNMPLKNIVVEYDDKVKVVLLLKSRTMEMKPRT